MIDTLRLVLITTPLLGFPGSGVALEDPNLKCPNGCWVWLTAEPGFMGDDWILCGPASIRDLSDSERGGDDWDDSIESLHTGPAATLHVWEDEQHSGPVFSAEAGSILRSLEGVGPSGTDFDSEISSLQLECRSPAVTQESETSPISGE